MHLNIYKNSQRRRKSQPGGFQGFRRNSWQSLLGLMEMTQQRALSPSLMTLQLWGLMVSSLAWRTTWRLFSGDDSLSSNSLSLLKLYPGPYSLSFSLSSHHHPLFLHPTTQVSCHSCLEKIRCRTRGDSYIYLLNLGM